VQPLGVVLLGPTFGNTPGPHPVARLRIVHCHVDMTTNGNHNCQGQPIMDERCPGSNIVREKGTKKHDHAGCEHDYN